MLSMKTDFHQKLWLFNNEDNIFYDQTLCRLFELVIPTPQI